MDDFLLEQVKQELDITWDDMDTDSKVRNTALQAASIIAHQIGVPADFDFKVPGIEQMLMLKFCMYLWNNVEPELFYKNYKQMILQARAIHEVEQEKETDGII